MRLNDICFILGTAHRFRMPGKRSVDGRLIECVYSRDICVFLRERLREAGIGCVIDYTSLDLPKSMQTPSVKLESQRELGMRVNFVNSMCDQLGSNRVFYVSIHNDASGDGSRWMPAHGWSVRVSQGCSEQSKELAESLWDSANDAGLFMRRYSAKQKYIPQDLYVLKNTKCPAVLTENLFQDNKRDVDFLLSDEGRKTIIDLHFNGIMNFANKLIA